MTTKSNRIHEVAFCAEVSKWADKLFESDESLPFDSSSIEGFGRGSQKRQDFRVYERKERGRGRLVLCGEVKLPGTTQGRSPFDLALMNDAYFKATNENCRYFFTWNVEHLALFDRSLWEADTMHERCVGQWKLGEELNHPTEVNHAEVIKRIKEEFLPKFFSDFADIYLGRVKDVTPPPPEFYIAVLESHLSGPMGPVRELRDYLALQSRENKAFNSRLREWMTGEQQWNFNPEDKDSWREVIDRAARSMAYVLSNRILFYQAVRLRNSLPELALTGQARKDPHKALRYLHARFQEAVDKTGDYESVFFPDSDDKDWTALMALSGVNSLESWDKAIHAIDNFIFKEIPTDLLGLIFQKLISPDERKKFGQFYTEESIVDVINAFCIRKGGDVILDPSCGSGSFLVRAYYRKGQLDRSLNNQEKLEGIYGCDINPFPAHLATLNLAARNIGNEENYPRIAHRNFFAIEPGKPFCELPSASAPYEGKRGREKIALPTLDAVIGNPPYVRQESIPKAADLPKSHRDQSKEHLQEAAERAWPSIGLSRQCDLHVYFWPVAAQFLDENGWFGFLTSSSWLDAKYGFQLQRWILSHFRLVAVIESVHEPWFEDARVKTAATILQRCDNERKRNDNLVRFVRLKRPLDEILGLRSEERYHLDEEKKQEAAEELRDLILKRKSDYSDDQLRIMVKKQSDLWGEGLSVAKMFARQKGLAAGELEEEEETVKQNDKHAEQTHMQDKGMGALDYGGGKWGRYLRAPDFYFEIMREFGHRFTRMGDIATIKFGIKSGCDAFFMPRNVSAKLLEENPSNTEWNVLPLMKRCKRSEVEAGKVIVVKCGDNTLHPIEAEFVRPEVHSLMQVDRPIVSPEQLDRVVLWVSKKLKELKGTYAHDFINWGSKQTFQSNKSKSVPVPERETCANRELWYDLTGLKSGVGFWPMAQQYRHIIPANPNGLVCNHNLFDIHPLNLDRNSVQALIPILNSTIVAFIKPFYGRYAGTEGNLKTEVVDSLLIEIPDPRNTTVPILQRLTTAFASMQQREVTHLVEEAFRQCHTKEEVNEAAKLPLGLPVELQQADRRELDNAVFELLGVKDPNRRNALIDQLYREVAMHYRAIRIVEVQKMEQRRHGGKSKVSPLNLALGAWGDLDPEWQKPLDLWLEEQSHHAKTVEIPDGEVRLPDAHNFFEATTVYFGKKPAVSHVCASRAEAELMTSIAQAGLRGPVLIPSTERECEKVSQSLEKRLADAQTKFNELAQQYAGTDKLREQVTEILRRWFIYGKAE